MALEHTGRRINVQIVVRDRSWRVGSVARIISVLERQVACLRSSTNPRLADCARFPRVSRLPMTCSIFSDSILLTDLPERTLMDQSSFQSQSTGIRLTFSSVAHERCAMSLVKTSANINPRTLRVWNTGRIQET